MRDAFLIGGAVVVIILLLLQWRVARLAQQPVGRAAPEAGQLGTAVYYFYSAHCGPCKPASAMVDRLQPEFAHLHKIDVLEQTALAAQFGVVATPSFVLVEDGVIRRVALGVQREATLRAWLAPR